MADIYMELACVINPLGKICLPVIITLIFLWTFYYANKKIALYAVKASDVF